MTSILNFKIVPVTCLAHILSPRFRQGMNIDQVHSSGHHFGMEGHKWLLYKEN